MDYKVNERYFERVLDIKKATDDLNEEQATQYLTSITNSEDDIIRFIFAGYLHAMESGAKIANVVLDMTYETLPNIIPATTALAYLQKKQGYDNQENAELTMKTLAAYLTLMAVNNHRAKIQVNKRASKRREKAPELWSYIYYLRINNKRDSDFLPPVIEGINTIPVDINNGFTVDINSLIGAYKRVTGVGLDDYGFTNLVIDFSDRIFEVPDELIEEQENDNGSRYSLNSLRKLITEIEDKINKGEPTTRLEEQLLDNATVVRDFLVLAKKREINLDLSVDNDQELRTALVVLGALRQEEGVGEEYIVQELEKTSGAYFLFTMINLLDDSGLSVDPVLDDGSNHLVISASEQGEEEKATFDTFEAMNRVKDKFFNIKTISPYQLGIKGAKPHETTRAIGVNTYEFIEIFKEEFVRRFLEETEVEETATKKGK